MSEETTIDTSDQANAGVTYLGSISLEKEQVQKIIVSYLVNNNPDLQGLSEQQDTLKFRPVWLTDENFMEIHFTRREEQDITEDDSEDIDLSLTDDNS
tara:strand:+ start:775 stop:1068 length:294 start_codon:yes stop_codon:yes gene_type:complete